MRNYKLWLLFTKKNEPVFGSMRYTLQQTHYNKQTRCIGANEKIRNRIAARVQHHINQEVQWQEAQTK